MITVDTGGAHLRRAPPTTPASGPGSVRPRCSERSHELPQSPGYPEENVSSVAGPRIHGANAEFPGHYPVRAHIYTGTKYPMQRRHSFSAPLEHEGAPNSTPEERPNTSKSQLTL